MAKSVRRKAIEHFVAALKGIKREAGYNFDVPADGVKRLVGFSAIPPWNPALSVSVGDETKDPQGTVGLESYFLPVSVGAWVKAAPDELADKVEDLLADIRKAVKADPSRGQNATDTHDLGAGEPVITEADEVWAFISIRFQINYRTAWSDPTSG